MDAVFASGGGVDIGSAWPLARIPEFQSLGGMVSYFLPKILILSGVVFFGLIIIAGIGVISGAGASDAHTKEKAKNFLTYSLIGFIIIFSAYWILQIINYILPGTLGGLFG